MLKMLINFQLRKSCTPNTKNIKLSFGSKWLFLREYLKGFLKMKIG